jgi:hypothetical protein
MNNFMQMLEEQWKQPAEFTTMLPDNRSAAAADKLLCVAISHHSVSSSIAMCI